MLYMCIYTCILFKMVWFYKIIIITVLPGYLEWWSDSNLHLVLFVSPYLYTCMYMYYLRWSEVINILVRGLIQVVILTSVDRKLNSCEMNRCTLFTYIIHLPHRHISSPSSNLPVRVHTEALLVLLPTPDFSMPYNVICFVSTVIAIGFGSLFNLTTKTLKPEVAKNDSGILQKLLSVFRRSS